MAQNLSNLAIIFSTLSLSNLRSFKALKLSKFESLRALNISNLEVSFRTLINLAPASVALAWIFGLA